MQHIGRYIAYVVIGVDMPGPVMTTSGKNLSAVYDTCHVHVQTSMQMSKNMPRRDVRMTLAYAGSHNYIGRNWIGLKRANHKCVGRNYMQGRVGDSRVQG